MLIKLVSVIILSILFSSLILRFAQQHDKKRTIRHQIDGTTKMNWKTLRDFYRVNPDRWQYTAGYILYTAYKDGFRRIRVKLTFGSMV